MVGRPVRTLVLTMGVALVAAVCPGVAGATVVQRGSDSGTDHVLDASCGFPLSIDVVYSSRTQFRVGADGEAFLEHTVFDVTETLTNTRTGGSFTITHHAVYHEIRATQVEGNVYEFVSIEAGQPYVIRDAAGRVVLRDRGVIRQTFLFDTLGDGMPGGDFVADLGADVHGPHPAFADDFPFCDYAARLTGA